MEATDPRETSEGDAGRGSAPRPLRVCIDARLDDGIWGGVQQSIIGLASGLSALQGDEQYLFLAYEDAGAWLGPYLRGSCRILPLRRAPAAPQPTGLRASLRRFDRRRRWFFRGLMGKQMPPARLAESDDTAERAGQPPDLGELGGGGEGAGAGGRVGLVVGVHQPGPLGRILAEEPDGLLDRPRRHPCLETAGPAPARFSRSASSRSASIMTRTSSLKVVRGVQPSFSRHLEGSPSRKSTSVGRK